MSKKRRNNDNGFAEWGGYMEAKKAKLLDQFKETSSSSVNIISSVFKGIAIFVNGYTNPTAEELKTLMAAHGGIYHHYQSGQTTHVIASNLPNVKIKQLGSTPIVKTDWITESIAADKLLDYRKYLLYTNQDRKQPVLNFVPIVHETKSSHKTLTASDPSFLAEFYNNSRLHLISTLGVEFKKLISLLRDNSNSEFLGRDKLKSLSGSNSSVITGSETVVMHIDMDCFFVSVGVRHRPDLIGVPVAVTHARSSQGPVNRSETIVNEEQAALQKYFPNEEFPQIDSKASMAEIASCSYEARKCGVRNGMFLGAAVRLCPNLKTIPYDFQGYREVATTLYKSIAEYTLDIEAVSCDEMYVDVGPVLHEAGISVDQWATHIRKEIMDATSCPCSTGFGANRLQARLATKKAKPAGQFHLKPEDVDEFMSEISLADLPGVGHATVMKLNVLGLKTCGDVQSVPISTLQTELGAKNGETIFQQCRGIDHKPLNFQHQRKSVSADVNYGIRFTTKLEALNFLQSLTEEVYKRLQDTGMRARCLTLKLLVRAPEAPKETPKFLGCGVCNAINRSTTTGSLINDIATIYKEAKTLFERANVPPDELRGVGIQLTRLEKMPPVNTALSKFLQTAENTNKETNQLDTAPKNKEPTKTNKSKQKHVVVETTKKHTKGSRLGQTASKAVKHANTLNKYFSALTPKLPIASNIDLNVLKELPADLRQEIIHEYGLKPDDITNTVAPTANQDCKSSNKSTHSDQKSPFEIFDWDELKPIIMSWFKTETQPAEIDIRLISEYFKKFAVDRKIEKLKKMINFLYRHIAKMGLCKWHEVYYKIINTVQEGMIAQYGSTLHVKRRFSCDVHS